MKGWTKYYGGEITRVNDDGTYDIKFDDGERKRGVKIVRLSRKGIDEDSDASDDRSRRKKSRGRKASQITTKKVEKYVIV